ncbi:serine hydrolase domain-containing protein [Ornithinibacillus bavariensis]|uniref:6-aminohexanoate-dimer hydrolase n=1 Tax=Ornithinibacillus bavariensis TaxID=545502 RepID=A0A919XCX2_9BACI|nr:serine hydrolase [Ornithinibacillus bavariensis]GIO28233.1 6-aminohexanoate-dimer hydrolase [Ornithinibacillus bavariensis]
MNLLTEFENKLKRDKVDSALVQLDNNVIVEYYRNKKMKEKQHKIYSVTKSILSILIGIAIEKGYIEHINTPISTYFPEINNDSEKQKITIKHLLTMTSGLHFPGNNGMIPSKNWVNFVLNQDMENPPGTDMSYSCGSSQLLSAIIQKTTGLNTEVFARKHLFTPLGITDYKWNHDAQGIAIGGFGLTMKTSDMLKIGTLYANKGKWKSKQIVPFHWIEESTTPKVKSNDTFSYAYHWWNLTSYNQIGRIYFAYGLEGQYIIVAPDYQLVTVFTSSMKEDELSPLNYFKDYLLPYVINSNNL